MNLLPRRSLFDFDDLLDVSGPQRGEVITRPGARSMPRA